MAVRKRFYTKRDQAASSFPGFPTYVEKTSRTGRRIFLFLVVLLLLAGAVLGGLYYLGMSGGQKLSFLPSKPTPTLIPETPTPSPSPTPVLARKDLSVAVLNGSGTAGAAGTMADYLKGLGYTVSKTGNASRFDYTKTTVEVRAGKQQFLSLLKDDLAKHGLQDIDATISAQLSTDAVVIVSK